ncbi:transmembrane emp24 domain-containing protein p24beta2-like [Durio zibethinus]|uniref:Transmembrane emp24 domain-containing protein p24beta2-like n=1 Tax=Durio zibethinus TaxID=66656 RepID=A0A6P6AXF8_DURZI|nr:transmembrane emp24 domain-containing protein p24beta2-like [Durio zibethinus]
MGENGWKRSVVIACIAMCLFLWSLKEAEGMGFVIDEKNAYLMTSSSKGTLSYCEIKGPSGDQIHDFRDKISEKYEFVVHKKGIYHFCFYNKSPYHETLDFDIQVGHFAYNNQHAKMVSNLEEALYNIQFEQHWIEAQTDRQATVTDSMGRRAIHEAMFESAALIEASSLQVYLLKRLFERKLWNIQSLNCLDLIAPMWCLLILEHKAPSLSHLWFN